jgi:serine/threonine-protein kinase
VVLRISRGPGLTTVPDVRRQAPASAQAVLRGAGLAFAVARRPSPTVPAGRVAGVAPAVDSQVTRGSQVTLVISSGPDRTPKVLGLRESEAERRLSAAGLRVVIVRQESAQPAGQVIAQRPQAGRRRPRAGTARIVVAARPPRVTVPAVAGLDLEAAATTLSGLGLRIEFRDRAARRGQRRDTVLAQDPPARSRLNRGGTVTLTVARR